MKQLLIISGKGGTGKTTVAAAFIRLAQAEAYADCDVDAPNLQLAVEQTAAPEKSDFYGMDKAWIDPEVCTACGMCQTACTFHAIKAGEPYEIDPYLCEGCGVCEWICPYSAVMMKPAIAGETKVYRNQHVFSTARLNMGSGNSGKLVTQVKKNLKDAASAPFAVIDGSPGIGCPVIASLSGVDLALIVTEPSLSGLSDLERIEKTARGSGVEIAVCVNKYDINPKMTERIVQYCEKNSIPMVSSIPYDSAAIEAANTGRSIADIKCPARAGVFDAFQQVQLLLE